MYQIIVRQKKIKMAILLFILSKGDRVRLKTIIFKNTYIDIGIYIFIYIYLMYKHIELIDPIPKL